ncbi:MAG: hypothetical protein M1365_03245 [Actinobacteria bacterium]|nr:hypothetical protein [Actinomycetota bacterium]
MISNRLIQKFKKHYLEEYKIQLTDEEATEYATELLNLMKTLLKPNTKEAK